LTTDETRLEVRIAPFQEVWGESNPLANGKRPSQMAIASEIISSYFSFANIEHFQQSENAMQK